MINRRMTRIDIQAEVLRRIMARVELVGATQAEVEAATRQVVDEIEAEIRAYWAARELTARLERGERLQ